jgi:hypothetical protein
MESGSGWRRKTRHRRRSELVRMSRMSKTAYRWCPRKPRSRRSLEERRGDFQDLSVSDGMPIGMGMGEKLVRQCPEHPCFLLFRWKVFDSEAMSPQGKPRLSLTFSVEVVLKRRLERGYVSPEASRFPPPLSATAPPSRSSSSVSVASSPP